MAISCDFKTKNLRDYIIRGKYIFLVPLLVFMGKLIGKVSKGRINVIERVGGGGELP